MNVAFLNNKDFWSGILFGATGTTALFIARDYPFGTAVRMGPGYFPIALGALLVLFGLYFVAKGLRSADTVADNWSLRALIVLPLALVLFGILMERAGFVRGVPDR
jgi:putative tricarboxylic transport membrane protein